MSISTNKEYKFLNEIVGSNEFVRGDYVALSKKIVKYLADEFSVSRVSLFLLTDHYEKLESVHLYSLKDKNFLENISLETKNFPIYFQSLFDNRSLITSDANNNIATSEFKETYFPKYNIKSLLDHGIREGDKLVGVLCLEQTEEIRNWDENLVNFVGNLGDKISTCYGLARIKEIENKNMVNSRLTMLGETTSLILHEIANPLTLLSLYVGSPC